MKFGKLYPSKYLAADDLNGRTVRLQIDGIKMEEVGQKKDWKPVLYLLKAKKGMVLNKTNGTALLKAYGDDTDRWRGKWVELFTARVEFQGNVVDAIRLRVPTGTLPAAVAEPEDEPPFPEDNEAPPPEELDDDVNPFD